ncbi:MAG: succinate dehydrogenase [Rhodospirillales bacterium]|nr:succinate dehydrogenase [Rhodospirillales bacterium]
MRERLDLWMWMAHRASAFVMAPLVLAHMAVMIYAIDEGLSASEILSRTQGSMGWAAFYGLFVIAASVHAAAGLRTVAQEHLSCRSKVLDVAALLFALALMGMGFTAVAGVTLL